MKSLPKQYPEKCLLQMFYYSLKNLKKMKKLILGLLTVVFMVSGAMAQGFEESCVIYLKERVVKSGVTDKSARSIKIKTFNSGYKLLTSYKLDGINFSDDGKVNDKIANYGIYTSHELLPNISTSESVETRIFKSDLFRYTNQLNLENPSSNLVFLTCKMKLRWTGSDFFGISCAFGCIDLYECRFYGGF